MILAIDTSTALTSVALVAGQDVLSERTHLDARRHAEVLAPLLRDLLVGRDRAQVRAVACGVGPGPYTGLRVGIATALAVGAAWDIPVHGICSLDAIAAAAAAVIDEEEGVCVATDARRREVYWASYSPDGRRVDGPLVTRPDEIDEALRARTWAGHGALAHAGDFGSVLVAGTLQRHDETSALQYPHACWIGRRAGVLLAAGVATGSVEVLLSAHGGDGASTSTALHGLDLLPPAPLYLRRPDVAEPKP